MREPSLASISWSYFTFYGGMEFAFACEHFNFSSAIFAYIS